MPDSELQFWDRSLGYLVRSRQTTVATNLRGGFGIFRASHLKKVSDTASSTGRLRRFVCLGTGLSLKMV
jgi:hypothetical protein